jgi:trehalose-phosphatase
MEVLHKNLDIDEFYHKLQNTAQRVLMLDYDGTLAPFVAERDNALPYPGIRELLSKLMNDSPTRVVIVSGRSVADLLRLLGLDHPPELWGSHGFERRLASGEIVVPEIPEETRSMLKAVGSWAEQHVPEPQREPKPAGYAFHWRGLDEGAARKLRERVESQWKETLPTAGLSLHEFDGGLEVRIRDINKGHAVRSLVAAAEAQSVISYLGDDLTDEDAFAALEHLEERALSVLVRKELRPTVAQLWLQPPGELLEFLRRWV